MENTGNILVRRGTYVAKTSSGFGITFALPIAFIGIGIAEILRRKYSNSIIAVRFYKWNRIFTLPTFLALAGTVVGLGSVAIGFGMVKIGKFWGNDNKNTGSNTYTNPVPTKDFFRKFNMIPTSSTNLTIPTINIPKGPTMFDE